MLRAEAHPVAECGEMMLPLEPAARDAGVEVAFSFKKHALGLDRLYYLRESQIKSFLGAAEEMNRRGWVMLVEDGFRTTTMQRHLARMPRVFDAVLKSVVWELGGKTPTPEFFLRRAMTLIAQKPKVGTHMSGSAIDISVLERGSDDPPKEVDRGGPYLEMSELTPMASPFVSKEAQRNRFAITEIMRRHGFTEYPFEFWHYNSGDVYDQLLNNTGRPGKYGAIDWAGPGSNAIIPVANPLEPLNSPADVQAEIDAAFKRMGR